jgi:hypothetical protein
VAIELAAVVVVDGPAAQFGGQGIEKPLAVGGAVVAAQLVLGVLAADEPVAEREADSRKAHP